MIESGIDDGALLGSKPNCRRDVPRETGQMGQVAAKKREMEEVAARKVCSFRNPHFVQQHWFVDLSPHKGILGSMEQSCTFMNHGRRVS